MKKIIGLIMLTLSACSYNHTTDANPVFGDGLEKVRNPGFNDVYVSIFSPRCVTCHAQYDNYEGVKRELLSIVNSITNDRMPKVGSRLTSEQKHILQRWVEDGAPLNAGEPAPEPRPTPLEPNWDSLSQIIFLPKCIVCHNPNGSAKFLDLSSRSAVFSARNRTFGQNGDKKLIDFDHPEQSYFIEVLKDEEEPMPPVWSNISKLGAQEIQIISDWIALGLP